LQQDQGRIQAYPSNLRRRGPRHGRQRWRQGGTRTEAICPPCHATHWMPTFQLLMVWCASYPVHQTEHHICLWFLVKQSKISNNCTQNGWHHLFFLVEIVQVLLAERQHNSPTAQAFLVIPTHPCDKGRYLTKVWQGCTSNPLHPLTRCIHCTNGFIVYYSQWLFAAGTSQKL
jgi:hypothetical protein